MKTRFLIQGKMCGILFPFLFCLISPSVAVGQPDYCRTGADALANVYVRANPVYALFFGGVEPYVADNREHFVAGGDSILCAQALSQALISGAIQNYDPEALNRQRELNTRLGSMGISSGPVQATAGQQLLSMSLQFARLARVLPPAANGNYIPFNTPSTDLEQMQMYATQMLSVLLQDPTVSSVFRQMEPMIKEAANMEFQIVLNMAGNLP